jgi:nucleotide-binding universal stress UspA family protein
MLKEILLPVDLQESELSERALLIAKDVAERYGSHITVMTVIPDFGMPLVASYFPDDAMKKAELDVCAELKRFVENRFPEPTAVNTYVDSGSPHKAIVKYATKHGVDLIVLPARAKDISKVFLGSSSTQVVERAPCSVLIVRPQSD